MQGARWCRLTNKIKEANPKTILEKLPIIWLKCLNRRDHTKKDLHFQCPVYKTTIRKNNYVFSILIPTEEEESHWITRGFVKAINFNYDFII